MTAAEAKKAGLVWYKFVVSGGKTTPLLGTARIETTGAMDPDLSFVIHQLILGCTYDEAQVRLAEAKLDATKKAAGKASKNDG